MFLAGDFPLTFHGTGSEPQMTQLATEVSGGLLSSSESLKTAEGGLNKGLWA